MDEDEQVCVDPNNDVWGPPSPPEYGPEPQPQTSGASGVEFCTREADLPGNSVFGVEHWWLRTPNKEGGMGPDDGGVPGHGGSDYPGKKTMITDHTGQGELDDATCVPAEEAFHVPVDPECIDQELETGRETGRWMPWNQCHTIVQDMIDKCRTYGPDSAEATDPDPAYRYTGNSGNEGNGGAGGSY